jgi:hypothetical protein
VRERGSETERPYAYTLLVTFSLLSMSIYTGNPYCYHKLQWFFRVSILNTTYTHASRL